MGLEVAGKTHVGMKRTHNEDAFVMLPAHGVFCVADGMGGHAAGEVASTMALSEIGAFFDYSAKDAEATWPFKMEKALNYDENRLVAAIKLANLRIFEASQSEQKYRGMGTTIVAASFTSKQAIVGHVGDSRVYQYSHAEKKLLQLTEDHSLLNDYIKAGKLSPEEIEHFPHKNVIVRAMGMKETVQVDINRPKLASGDIILLCCDGLSGMVTDPAMAGILAAQPDLEKAACQLIDAANAGGGVDNITVILVRWNA